MLAVKIPIWKTGGIAIISYLIALVLLTAAAKSDEFWSMLFATPRFRTGFIIYSMPFLLTAIVLISIGRWIPSKTSFVIMRRVMVGLCILVLGLAIGLMKLFGSVFDFKLSI